MAEDNVLVLIPAYNEELTIGSVVALARLFNPSVSTGGVLNITKKQDITPEDVTIIIPPTLNEEEGIGKVIDAFKKARIR